MMAPGICAELEGAAGALALHVDMVDLAEGVSIGAADVALVLDAMGRAGQRTLDDIESLGGVNTVAPVPGDPVVSEQTYTVSVSGGEGIQRGGSGTLTVTALKSGQYQVTMEFDGEAGPGFKGGLVSAHVGVGGGETMTWYVGSQHDADKLRDDLWMAGAATVTGGFIGAGLAKTLLQIPAPSEATTDVNIQAEGGVKTPGIELSAAAQAGATVTTGTDGTVAASQYVELSMDGQTSLASNLGFGASDSFEGSLKASIIESSGSGPVLQIDGSIETDGELTVDNQVFGVGASSATKVTFTVTVPLGADASAIEQAIKEAASNPAGAESLITEVLRRGASVHYNVLQGSVADSDFSVPGADLSASMSTFTSIAQGSFPV
jgi:hypothetical protein